MYVNSCYHCINTYVVIHEKDKGLDISNCTIDEAFTKVSFELLNLLDGKISVGKIRFVCYMNANTTLGIGYPEDLQQQMNAATTVTRLFEVLALHPTHWSWVNNQVMEKIASLTNHTETLFGNYKTLLSDKKAKNVLRRIPKIEMNTKFYCKIKEKWRKEPDEITVKDIDDHRSCIGEILGISKSTMILAFVDMTRVGVENNWLIPKALLHHVQNEFQKNKAKLSLFCIVSVEIESLPMMQGMYCLYIASKLVKELFSRSYLG